MTYQEKVDSDMNKGYQIPGVIHEVAPNFKPKGMFPRMLP